MTLDTYSHVLPSMQREAVDKLNALFLGKVGAQAQKGPWQRVGFGPFCARPEKLLQGETPGYRSGECVVVVVFVPL